MKAGIVVFPGTNRDRDAASAWQQAAGRPPQFIWHKDTDLPPLDLVILPGGFSHGDYLRAGAIAARAPIMAAIRAHAMRGGYVLGICNGFQILTEAGLLPGALLRNANQRFLSMICRLLVEQTDSVFTRRYQPGQVVRAPMAHGDGNFFADDATLDALEQDGLIAFRYADENRNGSARAIAGIFSPNRRVLGLMPHLENLTDPLTGGTDGAAFFAAMADADTVVA